MRLEADIAVSNGFSGCGVVKLGRTGSKSEEWYHTNIGIAPVHQELAYGVFSFDDVEGGRLVLVERTRGNCNAVRVIYLAKCGVEVCSRDE
jgi:hypothetical protein